MDKLQVRVMKTTGSAILGAGYFKLLHSFLFSTKGFLAGNSKFMFMNMVPIPNATIVMIVLILIGAAYLWHIDINK